MENRVLFRCIRKNGYRRTKPCTFWQKYILRGKSENHGTKVEMKMWFRNGLQMFQTSEIQKLDASYFNIVLTGDYDVTIQSKNTGHYWYLHNTEYPVEESCIIFYKHKASHPYHRYGKSENLRQAIRSIKGYDVFQMNGRTLAMKP